jgi:dihydroorotate dehydrogenase
MGLEKQPLFVKLAPDIPFEELDAIVDVVGSCGISGIVATNTTLDRSIVSDLNRTKVKAWGEGGLSGRGLKIKAREVQRRILARLPKSVAFMACGGIGSAEDALVALKDGAALVQVYSALIFEGPLLIGRMNRGLAEEKGLR